MRGGLPFRLALGLCAVVLAAGLLTVASPARAATTAEAPPSTVVPPVPDELDPLTAAISPVLWQACTGVGLALGVTVVAGTLLGVPADVGVPLNDLVATVSGPVSSLFFEACQQIPLPDEAPDCAVDAQVPALPSLGRPVLLAGLLANELRALDALLERAGVPVAGALGEAADDLLSCADGKNPAPDALTPEPAVAPPGGPVTTPTSAAAAAGSFDRAPAAAPASVEGPGVGAAAPAPDLPVALPASTSRTQGTGLAIALLALAGLGSLLWVHAGNRRPTRSDAPGGGA